MWFIKLIDSFPIASGQIYLSLLVYFCCNTFNVTSAPENSELQKAWRPVTIAAITWTLISQLMWILNLIVWNIYYHGLFKCILSVHVSFTWGDTASRREVAVAKHNLMMSARHEKCGKSQNKWWSEFSQIISLLLCFWEIKCFTAGGAGLHICWKSLIKLKGFGASYIIILFCVHVYSEVGFPAQKDFAQIALTLSM